MLVARRIPMIHKTKTPLDDGTTFCVDVVIIVEGSKGLMIEFTRKPPPRSSLRSRSPEADVALSCCFALVTAIFSDFGSSEISTTPIPYDRPFPILVGIMPLDTVPMFFPRMQLKVRAQWTRRRGLDHEGGPFSCECRCVPVFWAAAASRG